MSSYGNHSELQLAALLREGDGEAFVEIYRRNWRSMYNSAFKRLRDEKQSEDLVQNIFTDLWERRGEVEIENIAAYLLTAVKFQVIRHTTRNPGSSPLTDSLESTLISSLQPEDSLIEQETLEIVKLWISALPEKRREIFLMYYREELSSSRIAEMLGISKKTVQNQLLTATNSIRDQLSKILFLFLIYEILV